MLKRAKRKTSSSTNSSSDEASESTDRKQDSDHSDRSVGGPYQSTGGGPYVDFRSLIECTKPDMDLICELYAKATTPQHLAQRMCALLELHKGQPCELGAQVDLYTHALQTATRAHRDGASDELVVCALLHDVGELLSPANHGDVGAGILRPYISKEAHWLLAHHEIFQGYYYFEHCGLDKNVRERWKDGGDGGHNGPAPGNAYTLCAEFCEKYDAPSFDPDYDNMPLIDFIPVLERVFAKKAFWADPTSAKAGAVTGTTTNTADTKREQTDGHTEVGAERTPENARLRL